MRSRGILQREGVLSVDRRERIEEEFELGEESEAVQEYETLTDDFLHITASLIADEVLQRLKGGGGVAVDLGAGPGSLVMEMAVRFPHVLVIGLDISLAMAQLGRNRAETGGVENAAFVVADVHQLPFKPESVGVIVSHGSMHHWRRIDTALGEIKHVLAEKGFIYMSDLRRDTSGEVAQEIAAFLNEKQARAFLNSVRAAYTIEELSTAVKEVALDHVRVEPERFSRRTIMRNIGNLKGSPMRGMSQSDLNLRVVSEYGPGTEDAG